MNEGLVLTSKTPAIRIYNNFLNILGIVLLIYYIPRIDFTAWRQVGIIAVLSFLTRLMPTKLPQGGIFSVSFLLDLVLLELYGIPVAVGVAAFNSIFAGLVLRSGEVDLKGYIFRETTQKTIIVTLAGSAFVFFSSTFIAFVIAFGIYFMTEIFIMALNYYFEGKDSVSENMISLFQMLSLNYIVLSPLAYFMAMIYRNVYGEMKLLSILLFYIPIMLVSHSFRLYTNIKRSYLNTIKTMVNAIEAKDPFTKGHSERVAAYAVALAKEMSYSRKQLNNIYYLALLHDCGKIGVAEDILNKSVSLTLSELEAIQEHVIIGARIVEKIKFLHDSSGVVLHHHERFDGKGYPSGLKGQEIPVEARLLTIVDAYDAMLNDRPHRPARAQEEVLLEMTRLSGSQFDPALVQLFKIVLYKRGELEHVI